MPLPVAVFSVSADTIHAGDAVQFMDRSGNEVTTREWRFKGGTPLTSNEQNPEVVYAIPGEFSATLTVYNTTGFDRKTTQIVINKVTDEAPMDFNSEKKGDSSCFIDTSKVF